MRKNTQLRPASADRVLVIGSWAKAQITIENIKRTSGAEVFAYMDIENPGIIRLADEYRIGSLSDLAGMVDYARTICPGVVIVTTAEPLSRGVVDALEEIRVPVFGPTRSAARLESDKSFARELLRKHLSTAVPEFRVFKEVEMAVAYAESLDWRVAVKPTGLTEGLGVKVYGDQLEGGPEVASYIKRVLRERIGGSGAVIVEEKLEGEEFTIQCLVDGCDYIPFPAVQDFKKLLSGDRGPNTASMGSYAVAGSLLPFMEPEDYVQACGIIRKTLEAFREETGGECRGFLYGQFMLTRKGLKLIEYNFRPGDPEWLNTMAIMKDSILEVITDLMNGKTQEPEFEKKASICRYIVPPAYPREMNLILDVSFDEDQVRQAGASIYYSCGSDGAGRLNVGSERGIALVATGETLARARGKVEQANELITGDFYYRGDIGSDEQIASIAEHVRGIRQ
jgi:phosphoribosylamine---glycine ligase